MKRTTLLRSARSIGVVVCAALLSISATAQPSPATLPAQLVLSSPYIFRGTVVDAGNAGRATVRVDEIYRGAASVGDFTRQEIVVERPADSSRREALFFTTPLSWGRTVVVRELSEIAPLAGSSSIQRQIAAIEQDDADRRLVDRLRTAEAVVSARVLEVAPIEQKERHPSEHDPQWHLARVAVTKTLAGKPASFDCGAGCVNVAFAASRDVMWVASPKLVKGDDVILLLRRDDPRAVRGKPRVDAYLLVDPADRLPRSEQDRVIKLLARAR